MNKYFIDYIYDSEKVSSDFYLQVDIKDKIYYIDKIHFYKKKKVICSIHLRDIKHSGINYFTMNNKNNVFKRDLIKSQTSDKYLPYISVNTPVTRKLKFKLDNSNFIFKNDKDSYFTVYELFINIDNESFRYIGNYSNIDNYYLFNVYKLNDSYILKRKKQLKSFYRLESKIKKTINYYELYTLFDNKKELYNFNTAIKNKQFIKSKINCYFDLLDKLDKSNKRLIKSDKYNNCWSDINEL